MKLSKDLEDWEFEMNRIQMIGVYWARSSITIKQCTMLWHFDDDPDVSILDQLDKEYGKEAPLTVTRAGERFMSWYF